MYFLFLYFYVKNKKQNGLLPYIYHPLLCINAISLGQKSSVTLYVKNTLQIYLVAVVEL